MAEDYAVGYGRPPKHGQFEKGRSGNPKGRPKGTRNLATDLEEELSALILVREGTQSKHISKQRAMVKALLAKAIKGDTKAINIALSLMCRLFQIEEADLSEATLPEDDRAILEAFQRRWQSTATTVVSTDNESEQS
jgi:hypothetical protein